MKKKFRTSFIAIIIISSLAFGQTKAELQFDGFYIAKTNAFKVLDNSVEVFTYIRFYEDGTVYTQAVNSYDPKRVSKWFGKDGRFEKKGTYKIDGTTLTFLATNNKSANENLEGAKTDKYTGEILDDGKLSLKVTFDNGDIKDIFYEFAAVDKK